MKRTLSIIAMLCGLCVCANAASMTTEWTGAAGPMQDTTYDLFNEDNWDNGIPCRGNEQGPEVIFNNTGTISLDGMMPNTSDGGSITVTGDSDVTLIGTRWMGNVTVGSGSTLNLGRTSFKSSNITLDGALNISSVCDLDSSGEGAWLTFGIRGIMNVNDQIRNASGFSISGLLATTPTDLATGEYEFITRTLITSVALEGGSMALGDFTAEDGSALTKAAGPMVGNAADYQGQYYLYAEGGDVKVQYVVAAAVPEPATATLGLLGLTALMMRRRRG